MKSGATLLAPLEMQVKAMPRCQDAPWRSAEVEGTAGEERCQGCGAAAAFLCCR